MMTLIGRVLIASQFLHRKKVKYIDQGGLGLLQFKMKLLPICNY